MQSFSESLNSTAPFRTSGWDSRHAQFEFGVEPNQIGVGFVRDKTYNGEQYVGVYMWAYDDRGHKVYNPTGRSTGGMMLSIINTVANQLAKYIAEFPVEVIEFSGDDKLGSVYNKAVEKLARRFGASAAVHMHSGGGPKRLTFNVYLD